MPPAPEQGRQPRLGAGLPDRSPAARAEPDRLRGWQARGLTVSRRTGQFAGPRGAAPR
jgi:hypothetical protein